MKKIESKDNCPLNGFNPCQENNCAWYMQVRGSNPNTGEDMDHWGCVMAWMPILLIENSQMQRQTGAAVESFRNSMVEANQSSLELLKLGVK